MLEQLDAERIEFELDFTELIPDDLPREGKRTAVPLLQSLPEPFRNQFEVAATLNDRPELATLTRERLHLGRRRLDETSVLD